MPVTVPTTSPATPAAPAVHVPILHGRWLATSTVDIPGAGAAAVDGTHVYFTRSGPAGIIYRVAR